MPTGRRSPSGSLTATSRRSEQNRGASASRSLRVPSRRARDGPPRRTIPNPPHDAEWASGRGARVGGPRAAQGWMWACRFRAPAPRSGSARRPCRGRRSGEIRAERRPRLRRRRTRREPPRGPARTLRAALDEGRLRTGGVLWRLHRHRRWARRRLVRPARVPRGRQASDDTRGAVDGSPGGVGGFVRRRRCGPVRLLLAGDRHEGPRRCSSARPRPPEKWSRGRSPGTCAAARAT